MALRIKRTDRGLKVCEYHPRTGLYANAFLVKNIEEWRKLSEATVAHKCGIVFGEVVLPAIMPKEGHTGHFLIRNEG